MKVHLAWGVRSACALVSLLPFLGSCPYQWTDDTKKVTCIRCKETLKFKRAQKEERRDNSTNR